MGLMDLTLLGQAFSDCKLSNVGASAYQLEHDFFTKEDLQITTASGGGGTPLSLGVDYQLLEEDEELSQRVTQAVGATRTVYHKVQVINATYQTGDLYHSGRYIADSNSAADPNLLMGALPLARGAMQGLQLSNNAGDANNDIDIAAGYCLDSTGAIALHLASALTKRLDAGWVQGTNQGGLDTGSKAASTWYYVHAIRKDADGTIDALFSASATAPTMPTGWTKKRRLGAVRTDASGNIRAFQQFGDDFRFKTFIQDRALAAIPDTNRNVTTLTVPPNTIARIVFEGFSGAGGIYSWVAFTGYTDAAASATHCNFVFITSETGSEFEVPADGSSQIAWRFSSSNLQLRIITLGWTDRRGKDEAA